MEKLTFRKDEVIAFVEDLIQSNAATDDQEELYQEYQWSGKLNKNNYTYKQTIKEMRNQYEGK